MLNRQSRMPGNILKLCSVCTLIGSYIPDFVWAQSYLFGLIIIIA